MTDRVEEIIAGCRKGDSRAQEKLYHMFANRMWVVCRRYAPDIEQARDILQEGFIVVFEKIHQYRGNGSFEGWMRRIFINMALAEYRKKRLLYCETNELQLYSRKESFEHDEEDTYEFSEAELLEMIASLPPQYRLVFNLYAIEEMSHKDIAQMLGISEGTSKSNLFRAREWLKKKLAEKHAGIQKALKVKW